MHSPVVLVGHSYWAVISSPAANAENVKALVFVAAFAPVEDESAVDLSGKNPGSTLASALGTHVDLPDGSKGPYIDQNSFPEQFASDLTLAAAKLMAAEQ